MSLAPAPTPDPLAGSSQYFKVKDLGTGRSKSTRQSGCLDFASGICVVR